jgi:uncharacterized protein (DUF934 family)
MPLLKNGAIVADGWTNVADDEELPAEGPLIVSLQRWRETKVTLLARGWPLGVRLTAEQTPGEIADDLEYLDLVALAFPAFTDGRSYSNARRLRERYGFKGEVRAIGDVLRDQYLAYRRCGFDALEVTEGETAEDWAAVVSAITTPMQPATDNASPAMSLRERRAAAC